MSNPHLGHGDARGWGVGHEIDKCISCATTIPQWLKKGLVVAKKLVVNDFWLVVVVIRLVVIVTINIACMQGASQKIIHTCAVPIYSVHFD